MLILQIICNYALQDAQLLHTCRYLIVIDDIWDTEPWEIIRCALPENGQKSQIITTTRIIDVAEHVRSCYNLNLLLTITQKYYSMDGYLAPKAIVLNSFLMYLLKFLRNAEVCH